MKKRNTAVNVITAILAVLLSVLLVILLMGTGLVGAANRMLSAKGMEALMTKTIESVDFEQIIIDSAADENFTEEDLAQVQMITRLLDSPAAKEVLSLFSQDMAASLKGTYNPSAPALTGEALVDIANRNADGLVELLSELSPEADTATIRQEMLTYVEENAYQLAASLAPTALVDTESLASVNEMMNLLPKVLIALIIVCVVLAGLIYACRYYRFGGFLWIGVDTAIVTLMMGGIYFLIGSPILQTMLGSEGEMAAILPGVLGAVSAVFGGAALILLGIAVLFIGLYILLMCTVVKKWKSPSLVGMTEQEIMEQVVTEFLEEEKL